MPKNIITEITFKCVNTDDQAGIVSLVGRAGRAVDFNTLLPRPLNVWSGNVEPKHEQAFGECGLDWSRREWGTKWNAYGIGGNGTDPHLPIVQTPDSIVITFQTAWSTPRKWLLALFHSTKLPFEYRWMDEGNPRAVLGRFYFNPARDGSPDWEEMEIEDENERRRIHKLLWGVEDFDD